MSCYTQDYIGNCSVTDISNLSYYCKQNQDFGLSHRFVYGFPRILKKKVGLPVPCYARDVDVNCSFS